MPISGPVKLGDDQLERLAATFRAFGEATRLAILQELKGGERSVSEIVACLTTSQANVSKQLATLHGFGLVQRRKQGTQVFYRIADPLVFDLCRLACDKLNRDATRPTRLRF